MAVEQRHHHCIRRLIKDGILPVVPGAPYQIRAAALQDDPITAAIRRTGRPCRVALENPVRRRHVLTPN